MNIVIEKCPAYHDERGDLIQFITKQILEKNNLEFGQIYLLTFNGAGVVRGNHYHNNSSEIFCLVSGSVEMIFEEVEAKKQMRQIFTASENEFYRISISPRIAHAVKSISPFAVMVSFSSREFDLNEQDKNIYRLI